MDVTKEGVMLLSAAIIEQAQEDYSNQLEYGSYTQARITADRDSRGIVGYILAYFADDNEYLKKQVEKSIQLERRKRYGSQKI